MEIEVSNYEEFCAYTDFINSEIEKHRGDNQIKFVPKKYDGGIGYILFLGHREIPISPSSSNLEQNLCFLGESILAHIKAVTYALDIVPLEQSYGIERSQIFINLIKNIKTKHWELLQERYS